MISSITVSMLITEQEMNMIIDKADKWRDIGTHTKTTSFFKSKGIEKVIISVPDKKKVSESKEIKYRLLCLLFQLQNNKEDYTQYINNIVHNTFPELRLWVKFKLKSIKYDIYIKSDYAKQYYHFFKTAFMLDNRKMERKIYSKINMVTLKNKDTKIRIGYYPLDEKLRHVIVICGNKTQKEGIHISIQLNKGKIHSLIRKYKLKDRTLKEILDYPFGKTIEMCVMRDYLSAILGKGDFYTLGEAEKMINVSSYTKNKKARLIQFIKELADYGDIECFLNAVENREVTVTNKRKTAMDYIRCLNKMGINPLTWKGSDNDVGVTVLPNPVKLIEESYQIYFEGNTIQNGNNYWLTGVYQATDTTDEQTMKIYME